MFQIILDTICQWRWNINDLWWFEAFFFFLILRTVIIMSKINIWCKEKKKHWLLTYYVWVGCSLLLLFYLRSSISVILNVYSYEMQVLIWIFPYSLKQWWYWQIDFFHDLIGEVNGKITFDILCWFVLTVGDYRW